MLGNYTWTTGSEHQGQIEISDPGQIVICLIWCARRSLNQGPFSQSEAIPKVPISPQDGYLMMILGIIFLFSPSNYIKVSFNLDLFSDGGRVCCEKVCKCTGC